MTLPMCSNIFSLISDGLGSVSDDLCFQKSNWSERANHFWNWCHLILSQAKIESSTKLGFTESMSLKGFSPLLWLCWSAIIIANHNVNNFEQMSMLKAKCDFDGGDCCPNENNRLWNTYCNDCQCLEWYLLVEKFEEQLCQTLREFLWLGSEIHWEQLVSGAVVH